MSNQLIYGVAGNGWKWKHHFDYCGSQPQYMGVGSQKGKGSEMAFDTEFSARWKSRIIILLFVNRYCGRRIVYTQSKHEWSLCFPKNTTPNCNFGKKSLESDPVVLHK
jgi:hypothetical protein